MHPDHDAWATASDRFEAVRWYREFGADASEALARREDAEHPLRLGVSALGRFFNTAPTTLIYPGDEWTTAALETALDLGFRFAASYYLATRIDDRFCWATHICAPYLDEPSKEWFSSGLPVVGYFHDKELSEFGVQWLAEALEGWVAAGARRFIDFRELAAAVGTSLRLAQTPDGSLRLAVGGNHVERPRDLVVRIRGTGRTPPHQIELVNAPEAHILSVADQGDGTGLVLIPPNIGVESGAAD